uniref:Uncharacterized protein n=1 Tax=Cyprinus carpio TaxID=7962 RepID=A0A8C2JDS3_CYPCA
MSTRLQTSSASYGGGFGGGSCQLGGGRNFSNCSSRVVSGGSPCRTSTTAWPPTWRRCAPWRRPTLTWK